MALGPVEVVVLDFPGSRFDGRVLPALERLVADRTISLIDGLLVTRGEEGDTVLLEIDDAGGGDDVAALASLCDRYDALLSEDDVAELTEALEPGSSAAVLVFEHTWVRPLRDAVVAVGGRVVDSVRIPAEVVAEVVASLEEAR